MSIFLLPSNADNPPPNTTLAIEQYTGKPRDAGVAAQHAFDEWEPGDERREKRSRACDEHALGASRKTGAACSDVLRIQ